MKKVALISFGCAKNLIDSEVMLGYLDKARYTFTSDPVKADIVILNTCGFIEPARKEAIQALREVARLKRKAKEKKIIVVGCYVERNKKSLKENFPEIDLWLGVNDFDKIVQAIEGKPFKESQYSYLDDHASPRHLSTPPAWTYVKISEGCSHQCSFCSIPLIKGSYRSRTISSILKEVEELGSKGVKEVNLVSQDSTYFGQDQGLDEGLSLLLKELLKIKEIEWIRFLYGYPEEISDSLLEIMQEKKICSYLDIPFQHSDSEIIRKMKRGMDGKRALRLVHKIRKKIPDIALRTSLVVGFPGEGREEFESLKKFVKEARFDHLGIFTYSKEEGTDSFTLGDPVRESTKIKRKEKIMEIQTEISYQNNQKYLNKQIDVLIEGTQKENSRTLIGRGRFQAPEVDGIIFIETQSASQISEIINSIQKVEIYSLDIYDLYGKLVQ
ncbi:MAG: 30S ribosomal protein S12 methylthiotransferase RimO [Candidatus Aminicenantes bacterium]|nr:MAG: 30S ribosomal protein S12 methylthiotransferase RimO [Candidatus Aminicenantes bacterium]